MAFALGPRAAAAGYRIASFDTVGSTNAEAVARARADDDGPLWVVASRQTEGRGRRGRIWSTQEGNLAASLLMRPRVTPAGAATLGFVAALALDEALRACAPGLELSLKWPNDVLVGGAKLAGILLESERAPGALRVVIGIGVNIASAPGDTAFPSTSLAALGRKVRPQDLFAALSDAWIDLIDHWHRTGMARIRPLWLAKAAGIGRPVSIALDESRVVEGVFETLDESGYMIVRQADGGSTAISAGDVHFGSARTSGVEAR